MFKDLVSNPQGLPQEAFTGRMIQSRSTEIGHTVLFEENHSLTSENPKLVPVVLCQGGLRWPIVVHVGDVASEVNHSKTELEMLKTDVL